MGEQHVKLTVTSIVKYYTGVIEISMFINDSKEYTFSVRSQHDVDTFTRLSKYNPGKALNWLKKNCIKE